MGLERVAFLLQGVDNIYETDEVFPVIAAAEDLTGRRYGADHEDDVRFRVVADHVRSSLMLIGDGVTPGNEGRGYVLRRLLRRAVRSMRLLGVDAPTLEHLLPVSMERMKASYPELETDFQPDQPGRVRRGGRVPAHAELGHDDPRHRGGAGQVVRCDDARRAPRRSRCTTPTASRST